MEECCSTCKNRLKLVMFDYSHGGCEHKDMGHVCTVLMSDGQITWIVGNDPDHDMCECWTPKEG